MSASSPALSTSPEPIRTWKIEGPPEIVEGIVMKVMTSCSLRPASRARKPPMAWIPSWELPAIRMTASETFATFGPPGVAVSVDSLMKIDRLTVTCPEKSQQITRQARAYRLVQCHTIIDDL